ncbi:ferrous iron transporter B, partial [Actinomyces naeslundii]
IGGVGSVLTFIPQIIIMFLIIAVLEGVGYMSRAAFLMDKVMSVAGLEGRAFVALLSSLACAIPGIMATRTLPSTKDRVATMLGAPLMTCSARLPVYVIMISLTVDGGAKIGPFGARGVVMFALYLLGAVSAMAAAWAVKQLTDRGHILLPFYMEMPPYRMPRVRTVLIMVWDACKGFLKKAGTIITLTTIILWVLLNVPMRSDAQFEAFCASNTQCAAISAAVENPSSSTVKNDDGEVVTDPEELDKLLEAQKTSYTMDNSWAAKGGKVVQPVFEPLGFDWRINVATLSSLAARETFVATLGQIAAAEDPEEPTTHLATMTYQQDTLTNKAGDKLFNPATVVAILVFFVYALQCMATAGAMRRETGSWKWPIIAFVYMFVTAWVMAAITHAFVAFFI